jgi:predicted dehydrogenase
MSRPRLGFVGTGWIGRHRMEAMLATNLVEAAAICEPNPEMAAEALKLAPEAALLPSLEAVLDTRPDGIVIATPSALHAAQSIAALERGVAVFCQKPLGRSAAEVAAVLAAARRADRLLGVDMSYRFAEAMQAVRALVRSGGLGPIHAVNLLFHNAYGPDKPWFYDPALSGGGCLMDLGIHLVDLALWTLDFPEVAQVAAHLRSEGGPVWDGRVEDYAAATLTLETGAVVQLACSWRLHAGMDAVIAAEFYGGEGGAAFRNVDGSFYDFTAERFTGTARERLAAPPDSWGGRAAAAWAVSLAGGGRYARSTRGLLEAASALDRLYQAGRGYPGRPSGAGAFSSRPVPADESENAENDQETDAVTVSI